MTGDEYFATINELTQGATPVGAFCVRLGGELQRQGTPVTRELLERLVACESVREGLRVIEEARRA